MSLHPAQILLRPVVSEKSYHQITENRYTFRVHPDAHKTQVRQAVEELFDVKVVGVNIVKMPPRDVPMTTQGSRPSAVRNVRNLFARSASTLDRRTSP